MASIEKKALSERDICTKFITPALVEAGWDLHTQIREEVTLTPGRVIVKGRGKPSRESPKRADYVLLQKGNIPVAIIEAKDNSHRLGDGMQQALGYAEMMKVPFVYSSNGDGFLEHDRTGKGPTVERELSLDEFPSPGELWSRYRAWRGLDGPTEDVVTQNYYTDDSGKLPRYYQINAINQTVEAIAKGQNRILLVMATGTGKTYTAFQIIWRLWKAGIKKRILFLADRNILIDQTKTNDFKPFGGAMTKISKRQVDKSFEIYLSLYQAVTGNEDEKNIYKQFSRDFFDLVVIDECHRGSAAEDAAWREILEYFSSATQIGLTATPKETEEVSNIHYFGDPVYTYSLRQGIEDGFLAPYKVVRIDLDKDLMGWRPEEGMMDDFGNPIDDRIYNQKDFDRNLILEKRTQVVAEKVTEFLMNTNRMDKTIIFCENIGHAERMRQALVNLNPDKVSENHRYVMRITGDEQEGKAELDNFINPEVPHPVIATTSRLMNTGVDAQTCKLIVLDQTIQSMTVFKQIIGRGTRINEDYDKYFFTIMDFKKATELFADPDFDGDPVQIYKPGPDGPVNPPDDDETDQEDSGEEMEGGSGPGSEGEWGENFGDLDDHGDRPRPQKYYVGNVPVFVIAERVQYYGKDGKLVTESLKDYTKKTLLRSYSSLNDFLRTWTEADKKEAVIAELENQGLLLEPLAEEVGRDYDPFDLICHFAYDQPPLTRKARAENVKKRDCFSKYGEKARAVLEALLEKYSDEGTLGVEDLKLLSVTPLNKIGTPVEIVRTFGGKDQYLHAVKEMQSYLYGYAQSVG